MSAELCGCCAGIEAVTPSVVQNRPGLSAIAYRVGQYATFKETMLAALSNGEYGAKNRRTALQTRQSSDFSIALIDAWATVADVLTFYQERIANEQYLRTATELSSLVGLSGLIGYQLRPGLAAATYVAFLVEDPPPAVQTSLPGINVPATPAVSLDGFVRVTSVPVGTRIQSVPGPGQLPQTFETTSAIQARLEWNQIRPWLTRPYSAYVWSSEYRVRGLASGLQPGDSVFVRVNTSDLTVLPVPRQVGAVTVDNENKETILSLTGGSPAGFSDPFFPDGVAPAEGTPLTASAVASTIIGRYWDQTEFIRLAERLKWDLDSLNAGIRQALRGPAPPLTINKAGIAARLFGHNAPDWSALPFNLRYPTVQYLQDTTKSPTPTNIAVIIPGAYQQDWTTTLQTTAGQTTSLSLDNAYKGIKVNAWIDIAQGNAHQSSRITSVQDQGVSAYSLHATATVLDINPAVSNFAIRDARISISTDPLPLAEYRFRENMARTGVELDGPALWLKVGQALIITGELSAQPGVTTSEVALIGGLELRSGRTRIEFANQLANQYRIATVTINANVAPASHGETRTEVLGSGDATETFAKFTLKHPPLTYLSAANTSGAQSTLQVFVNNVQWQEVPTLYGSAPGDHVYIVRQDVQGNTYVQFGDGVHGAPLPTGTENVQAIYRQGLGASGLLAPGQLRLLLARPLGIRDVSSPVAPEGGADPETLSDAQFDAPLSVRTLGRIVSLRDFEDFARASAGVSRSQAVWAWDGHRQIVLLTVAGPGGTTLTAESMVLRNLIDAIAQFGDPNVPVSVASFRLARFRAAVRLKIDGTYVQSAVVDAVRAALESTFSFVARELGQPVTLAELVAAAQAVPGVVALTVPAFFRNDAPAATTPPLLLANGPSVSGASVLGAEMLLIEPGIPDLGVMS